MAEIDRDALLARFSRGALTADERRALFEAALSDQELFDVLAEEDALRDVLDDPHAKEVLAARLAPGRRSAPRRAPLLLTLAASFAAALVGGYWVLTPRPRDILQASWKPSEAGALWKDSEVVAKSLGLEATLEIGRGARRFHPGEPIDAEVFVSSDAQIVLLVRPPSGTPRVVLPPPHSPPPRVTPGDPQGLGARHPLLAPLAPGRYGLRLVALAAEGDVDLSAFLKRLSAGEARVVEIELEVVP